MSIQWKSLVIACTLLSVVSVLIGCKSNGTGNWYSYKNYSLYNPFKSKAAKDAPDEAAPVVVSTTPASQNTPDANLPVISSTPAPEIANFNSQAATQVPNIYTLYPASQAPPEYQQTSFHQTNEDMRFCPVVGAPALPQPCSCNANAYAPVQNAVPQTCPQVDANGNGVVQQSQLPVIAVTNP